MKNPAPAAPLSTQSSPVVGVLLGHASLRRLLQENLRAPGLDIRFLDEAAAAEPVRAWLTDLPGSARRTPVEAPVLVLLLPGEDASGIPAASRMELPAALGAIAGRLAALATGPAEPLRFGPYMFLPQDLLLRTGAKDEIRLTEKERDILLCLLEAQGPVERRELLDKVWGYAETVETHTIETHIYRLRQKIEMDPASPQYLLTDGTGYRLAD